MNIHLPVILRLPMVKWIWSIAIWFAVRLAAALPGVRYSHWEPT
jgi:hypothetical protein